MIRPNFGDIGRSGPNTRHRPPIVGGAIDLGRHPPKSARNRPKFGRESAKVGPKFGPCFGHTLGRSRARCRRSRPHRVGPTKAVRCRRIQHIVLGDPGRRKLGSRRGIGPGRGGGDRPDLVAEAAGTLPAGVACSRLVEVPANTSGPTTESEPGTQNSGVGGSLTRIRLMSAMLAKCGATLAISGELRGFWRDFDNFQANWAPSESTLTSFALLLPT